MSFSYQDIKGAVVGNDLIAEYENEINIENLSGNVVKEAQAKGIVMGLRMMQDAQSSVRLRLNREKLAKHLFGFMAVYQGDLEKNWTVANKEYWLEFADAINAADKDIVEVDQ